MSKRAGDLVRTTARGVGQTFLTVGFVLLLFVVYELWVTDLQSAAAQDLFVVFPWAEPYVTSADVTVDQ